MRGACSQSLSLFCLFTRLLIWTSLFLAAAKKWNVGVLPTFLNVKDKHTWGLWARVQQENRQIFHTSLWSVTHLWFTSENRLRWWPASDGVTFVSGTDHCGSENLQNSVGMKKVLQQSNPEVVLKPHNRVTSPHTGWRLGWSRTTLHTDILPR